MKDFYEISNLMIGRVTVIYPCREISPIVETNSVYNIVCKKLVKRKGVFFFLKEEVYVEIFTEGQVDIEDDNDENEGVCFRYFDTPYFKPEINISEYLAEDEKTKKSISKFRVLEIYNDINFKKEK